VVSEVVAVVDEKNEDQIKSVPINLNIAEVQLTDQRISCKNDSFEFELLVKSCVAKFKIAAHSFIQSPATCRKFICVEVPGNILNSGFVDSVNVNVEVDTEESRIGIRHCDEMSKASVDNLRIENDESEQVHVRKPREESFHEVKWRCEERCQDDCGDYCEEPSVEPCVKCCEEPSVEHCIERCEEHCEERFEEHCGNYCGEPSAKPCLDCCEELCEVRCEKPCEVRCEESCEFRCEEPREVRCEEQE